MRPFVEIKDLTIRFPEGSTSFEAVNNILAGVTDKKNVWSVNTEEEYHESK